MLTFSLIFCTVDCVPVAVGLSESKRKKTGKKRPNASFAFVSRRSLSARLPDDHSCLLDDHSCLPRRMIIFGYRMIIFGYRMCLP
jgi:hypothetical protein